MSDKKPREVTTPPELPTKWKSACWGTCNHCAECFPLVNPVWPLAPAPPVFIKSIIMGSTRVCGVWKRNQWEVVCEGNHCETVYYMYEIISAIHKRYAPVQSVQFAKQGFLRVEKCAFVQVSLCVCVCVCVCVCLCVCVCVCVLADACMCVCRCMCMV